MKTTQARESTPWTTKVFSTYPVTCRRLLDTSMVCGACSSMAFSAEPEGRRGGEGRDREGSFVIVGCFEKS